MKHILLLFLFLSSFTTSRAQVPTAGLVAHYGFNETQGTMMAPAAGAQFGEGQTSDVIAFAVSW